MLGLHASEDGVVNDVDEHLQLFGDIDKDSRDADGPGEQASEPQDAVVAGSVHQAESVLDHVAVAADRAVEAEANLQTQTELTRTAASALVAAAGDGLTKEPTTAMVVIKVVVEKNGTMLVGFARAAHTSAAESQRVLTRCRAHTHRPFVVVRFVEFARHFLFFFFFSL
jgi:hypothetical protein